jgi:predicted Zn-dependent protease with MMP-like domain
MAISLQAFEVIVQEELKKLPKVFRDRLKNVMVVIEEGPAPEDEGCGEDHEGDDDELTGLYEGVPLTELTVDHAADPPGVIRLFKEEIEAEAREEGIGLKAHIRRVLRHEIAHHFGISDERLEDLGEY